MTACKHYSSFFLLFVYALFPSSLRADIYSDSIAQAPWCEELLAPSWRIGLKDIRARVKHSSPIKMIDGQLSLQGSVYPQVDCRLSLSSTYMKPQHTQRKTLRFPAVNALQLSIKKGLSSDLDISSSRSCFAASVGIDIRVVNRSRYESVALAEAGRTQGQLSYSIGKHVAILSSDTYLQWIATATCATSTAVRIWKSVKTGLNYAFLPDHMISLSVQKVWSNAAIEKKGYRDRSLASTLASDRFGIEYSIASLCGGNFTLTFQCEKMCRAHLKKKKRSLEDVHSLSLNYSIPLSL